MKHKHALRAHAESRGKKAAICWFDQSYVHLVGQQKDDAETPDLEKNRGQRQRAEHNRRSILLLIIMNVQLVGQGGHKKTKRPECEEED